MFLLLRFEMASHVLAIRAQPAELLNALYHGVKTAFPAHISGAAGESLQRRDADPEVVVVERRNGCQRALYLFERHITIGGFDVKTLEVIDLTERELGIPANADEHAFSLPVIVSRCWLLLRHARACPGHPRLFSRCGQERRGWPGQ